MTSLPDAWGRLEQLVRSLEHLTGEAQRGTLVRSDLDILGRRIEELTEYVQARMVDEWVEHRAWRQRLRRAS